MVVCGCRFGPSLGLCFFWVHPFLFGGFCSGCVWSIWCVVFMISCAICSSVFIFVVLCLV